MFWTDATIPRFAYTVPVNLLCVSKHIAMISLAISESIVVTLRTFPVFAKPAVFAVVNAAPTPNTALITTLTVTHEPVVVCLDSASP
jgi:hypothetical protein